MQKKKLYTFFRKITLSDQKTPQNPVYQPLLCSGKYDILQKKAELLAPPRLKAIRDFLDPGMLEEAAFHILDYYAPTDSENPLCKNHSSFYQDAFLRDQTWAVRSKCRNFRRDVLFSRFAFRLLVICPVVQLSRSTVNIISVNYRFLIII